MEVHQMDILVEDRTRKDFGNLQGLSESIKKHGLIQPLVVEPDGTQYRLIAGERRLRACLAAGLTNIPCVLREELKPLDRKELELEENLHRKDFTWPEQVELVRQIDEINRKRLGSAIGGSQRNEDRWNTDKLAQKLDMAKGGVSQDIQLANFLLSNPDYKDKFAKLPKTTAFRKVKEIQKRQKITDDIKTGRLVLNTQLRHCDAIEGMSQLERNSIDLILTDPPYGTQAVQAGKERFADMVQGDNLTENSVMALLEEFIKQSWRVLKPGHHLYMFFALEYYNFLVQTLNAEGFLVNRYPIIWAKTKPTTPATGLNFMRSWEPCLFAIKDCEDRGDLLALGEFSNDLMSYEMIPPRERVHVFEKPQKLLSYLIKLSTHRMDVVLDPFAGSASTLIAAYNMERKGIGFESNPDHFANAQSRLSDSTEDLPDED
ncbi:MAG: putative modification methylase [Prokaryotic dsDNA virus sp.]|nr:MAG: putative modification methylase [Prokaryotic dsDNA virus sp.]|tara:strand:- start:4862 stop:6157 length:1296 start_codon:yes stop_codon:yes gene_type:complete